MINRVLITRLFGFTIIIKTYETREGEFRHNYEKHKTNIENIMNDAMNYIEDRLKNLELEIKERK